MKIVLGSLALFGAMVLLSRSAPADTTGVRVDNDSDGLVVTVYPVAANVHFTYNLTCDDGKPCYLINASQGMTGIPATSSGCKVDNGNAYTPTAIRCPESNVGSVQFVLLNGGTWSAYQGGGGQHAGAPCSPANVIVKTGAGVNVVDSWDGCKEVIYCDTGKGGLSTVEADAEDDVHGTCSSVVKH